MLPLHSDVLPPECSRESAVIDNNACGRWFGTVPARRASDVRPAPGVAPQTADQTACRRTRGHLATPRRGRGHPLLGDDRGGRRRGGGGRNRDRTYDLCDVNAALVPTELCARESPNDIGGPRRDQPAAAARRGSADLGGGPGPGGLGGADVGRAHLHPEAALALVADQVEGLGVANRTRDRLAVTAALAGDDGSHLAPELRCRWRPE